MLCEWKIESVAKLRRFNYSVVSWTRGEITVKSYREIWLRGLRGPTWVTSNGILIRLRRDYDQSLGLLARRSLATLKTRRQLRHHHHRHRRHHVSVTYCTWWAKKLGDGLMAILLSNLNQVYIFFTGRFLGKFAVKWILKVPPHLACVATLPCETLMSAKQAIKDKWQGSVATYLRCGGVNNQIKNGLLLSLWVIFLSRRTFGSYKQERGCLMHFACLANTLLKDGESARN